jgi:4a-hydroxytetrahydrobiopterin dehydratase
VDGWGRPSKRRLRLGLLGICGGIASGGAVSTLKEEKCVACRADAPHVTEKEVANLRPEMPEWELLTEEGIKKLTRVFRFPNFREAMSFAVSVGDLAEAEGHHPRLVTEWGRVTVTWWTHKILGLHRNDFIMAAKTDELFQGRESRSKALG